MRLVFAAPLQELHLMTLRAGDEVAPLVALLPQPPNPAGLLQERRRAPDLLPVVERLAAGPEQLQLVALALRAGCPTIGVNLVCELDPRAVAPERVVRCRTDNADAGTIRQLEKC